MSGLMQTVQIVSTVTAAITAIYAVYQLFEEENNRQQQDYDQPASPTGQPLNISRNGSVIREECANCRRKFEGNEANVKTLECRHRVHYSCWNRMRNSGISACPKCIRGIEM